MVAVVLNPATFFSFATKEDEKERYKGGEEKLLNAYNKWIFRKRKDELGGISHGDAAYGNEAIHDFDCFVQTRWILKHELLYETPRKWQTIIEYTNFLFNDIVYKEACLDLHPGLMADLAGRWFCDYYFIPGPAGFFIGSDVARYIAVMLNPYELISEAHRKSFIQNGLQHRNKFGTL